jgi:cytochrome c oxidase subunit 2
MTLFPTQGSTIALPFDILLLVLVVFSILSVGGVGGAIIYFAIRYRAGSGANRKLKSPDNYKLELAWTLIPTVLVLGLFAWSAKMYYDYFRVPDTAQEILVTGKQWMWKIQHPNGRREINELHIPVNTPIKLTMTSEDVIHSFFIPEFRVKKDVLPSTYSTLWFEATTTTGSKPHNLFCAEYCGLNHSTMVGKVHVLEQAEYERWLKEGNVESQVMASSGERLFNSMGCVVCHRDEPGARGPSLNGLFGSEVALASGETVVADDDYIRESILNPQAKIVQGYTPLMPTFKNSLSQEDVFQLVTYIRGLADAPPATADAASAGDAPANAQAEQVEG